MEDLIYRELILSHWKNPRNYGKIKNPNKISFSSNPACGDKIKMEAKIKKGKIEDIKFTGEGCIISKAAASLLTEYAKGKDLSHLKNLNRDFMLNLLGIQLSPVRLKCALLALEVLEKLIRNEPPRRLRQGIPREGYSRRRRKI